MTQIEEWWSAALADLSFVMDDSVNWMEMEKWFDIYECVEKWRKNCSIQEKRVSCNHIFHAAHFKKDIFFYEKNHALLVREPISFMLKQTFFWYHSDIIHVYIALSALNPFQKYEF